MTSVSGDQKRDNEVVKTSDEKLKGTKCVPCEVDVACSCRGFTVNKKNAMFYVWLRASINRDSDLNRN